MQDNNKCQHKIQTISMFKLKITVHVSTLKNSVVKLFVATSVQQECCETEARRESARMNEGGSLGLIVCLPNQCVFLRSLES